MSTRTRAPYPQFDGLLERMERTIGKSLSKRVFKLQRDWDQYHLLFSMGYKLAVNESIGETQPRMQFGKEMRQPCELVFGCKPENKLLKIMLPNLGEEWAKNFQQVQSHIKIFNDRDVDTPKQTSFGFTIPRNAIVKVCP